MSEKLILVDEKIKIDTAKLAKEKGYNEICDSHFEEDGGAYDSYGLPFKPNDKQEHEILYARPTQSLLQRWLREVHNIHIYVNHYEFVSERSNGFYYHIGKSVRNSNTFYDGKSKTYEVALEKGLVEALKKIKK